MAASNNHRLTVTVKPNSGHTLFRYTAKDIDGKVVRGAMEAADYDTLYTQLLAQGLYLQSATCRGAGRKPRTLRPQELSDLCRQLSTLLASGVSLSAALETVDGFQRKLCSSIAVGEETGRLDSMLDSIADSMEYDAQQASKRMTTILEPMLIVLMAFVVGFIIIAVMSPIIGSYSAIESSGNV